MSGPFPSAVAAFPRLRQSLLASFDACGLASHFAQQHEQGWSTHAAARGTLVHRAFAKCFELMDVQQEQTIELDIALEILDEVIRQHDVPMESQGLGDRVVTLRLADIADCRAIVRSFARHTSWPIENLVGIEERLDATVSYPDGEGGQVERTITGQLDLLLIDRSGEHATVWDHKTSWAVPAEKAERDTEFDDGDLSEEGYFQQRVYALLVFATYPRVQRVTLREFYPRWASGQSVDRKGRPINPVREATLERYLLPELVAEFSALVERFDRAYESNVWTPAPGSHCSYCVRPEACTIFPAARAEGRIASAEEAERLAGRLAVLDALKRQTTAALRAWAKEHGEIPVRDPKRPKVYGPVVRSETSKPDLEVVRQAIANGVDPAELYITKDVAKFVVHTPEEVHPHAAAARAEEETLLAEQRAEADRRAAAR